MIAGRYYKTYLSERFRIAWTPGEDNAYTYVTIKSGTVVQLVKRHLDHDYEFVTLKGQSLFHTHPGVRLISPLEVLALQAE